MKIITVNLPPSYVEAIDKLVGNDKLYPSRSEAVRVAVKEFLIREMEAGKSWKLPVNDAIKERLKEQKHDEDNYVRIPMGSDNFGNEQYKLYRLVKR